MALGSTHPLTEMGTRSISWGKRRPVRKADNLPPSCAVVMKSGNLNFLKPSGPLQVCNGADLPFLLIFIILRIFYWMLLYQILFSLFQVREISSTDGAEFGKNICVCCNFKPFFKKTYCNSLVSNVNKNPTRCNSMQIFIYCKITLHVSGVHRTHHQEY